MRNCKKNERTMYYALYSEKIPIKDENGYETFEYKIGYSNPVQFKGSLSLGQSKERLQPFGSDVDYDRVILTCDKTLPIDENSIIWVKNIPTYNEDKTVNANSADYTVTAEPLDSLNSLLIAIKKVSTVNSNTNTENVENEDDSGF